MAAGQGARPTRGLTRLIWIQRLRTAAWVVVVLGPILALFAFVIHQRGRPILSETQVTATVVRVFTPQTWRGAGRKSVLLTLADGKSVTARSRSNSAPQVGSTIVLTEKRYTDGRAECIAP